jgi:hypothetical protein
MDRVAAPHGAAATATVHSKLRFFLVQQIIWELRFSFPVGTNGGLCLLNH